LLHGDFEQNPQDHLKGRGCSKCNRSKGEQLVEDFLNWKNINYKSQIKFVDCKDKNRLSFDFGIYLKDNLYGLIEFQGRQHYESIKLFGGASALTLYKYHDKLKKEYCQSNNIPLLEIPYIQKDKIPELVQNFIETLS
jgi:hypothetical protein